jgi:ribosomal protein S18 acetylase RimI-like enzyme
MSYNFRRAEISDLDGILAFNNIAFANNRKWDEDSVIDYASTPEGAKYFSDAIKDKKGCFFICEENGHLVGYATGAAMDVNYRKSKYFELISIGVHPNRLGQGVGKALLEKITRWAKSKRFQKIYLNCYIKNKSAIDFYTSQGYSAIDICMEKDIAS